MNEIEKVNSNLGDSVVYDLPVRDDLFCFNCKVPSVHHRLYPASIGCFKNGNDWHLTCKGTTIAIIPPHVIQTIFESLSEAYKTHVQACSRFESLSEAHKETYKTDQLSNRFPLLENHVKKRN